MAIVTSITNVIGKDKLRKVQTEAFEVLATQLSNSFGPVASHTGIMSRENVVNYSKDGHTILKNIKFKGVIEESVRVDLEEITRNITRTVGDGTTSAVILSAEIFKSLNDIIEKGNIPPYKAMRDFKTAVKTIQDNIKTHAQAFDADVAYDIAYVSTNGNAEVAQVISDIYKEHGNEVSITVNISPSQESMIKVYDGITLDSGFADTCFINNNKGIVEFRNPKIYAFADPVDTPEMNSFFEKIIFDNITSAKTADQLVPTVIMAPKVTRDLSPTLDRLAEALYRIEDIESKPPLLVISDVKNMDRFYDLAILSGAKFIRKYIDPKMQDADIEKGLAPTLETLHNFAGEAELVSSDSFKTKFINPVNMYDENGELSDMFRNHIRFLEAELMKLSYDTDDIVRKNNIKKRINSLKSNLVEYLVGGVTISDRDNLRDLIEDAVLNCTSAASKGAGFAANYEGLRASYIVSMSDEIDEDIRKMAQVIFSAYEEVVTRLYATAGLCRLEESRTIVESLRYHLFPYDIRAEKFSNKLLTSIDTDIVILDGISKILSLTITSNQFIVPDIAYNLYLE